MESEIRRTLTGSDAAYADWVVAQAKEDAERAYSGDEEAYMRETFRRGAYGWNHATFRDISRKMREYDDYILRPYEVEEGVLTCRRCSSKKVYSSTRQTRAADEPMTTLAKCSRCGLKWSQNG